MRCYRSKHRTSGCVLQAVLSLSLLVGFSSSSRVLLQGAQCGEFLPNMDISGPSLPGSRVQTANNAACLALCENTDGCTAMVRISRGLCFLKAPDPATVAPSPKNGVTSHIICSDVAEPPDIDEGGVADPECGEFLANTDVPGGTVLPGSRVQTANNQACLTLCENTNGCTAAIRRNNGQCFLKAVDTDLVAPVNNNQFTSYIICDAAEPPDIADPPINDDSDVTCGELLPNMDVPGGTELPGSRVQTPNNAACLALCQDTAGCNVAIRRNNGRCFLKAVDIDLVAPVDNNMFTSYIICDGAMPPNIDDGPGDEGIAASGKFGAVIPLPLIPVASAALPNGKVLMWAGTEVNDFRDGVAYSTFYVVFDTDTETVESPPQNQFIHDMFCPGIAMLPNGDIMVVGGSHKGDGAGSSSIFTGSSFTSGPDLQIPRGYNSAVTLANGNVFTLGGSFSGEIGEEKDGEIFEGNAWRKNANILSASIKSDDPDGVFRVDNYPFLFAWKQNSVFHAGPSKQMNWFTNLGGAGTTTPVGNRSGQTAMNGNFVMYAEGKILTVGGALSYSLSHPARTGAEVIELGAIGVRPNVRTVPGPATARTYATAVVLPTGEVAHFGGKIESEEWFNDDGTVFETEIWNPITETWRIDASHAKPRQYHSSAVLVPDGRVSVGGGGLCGTLEIRCRGGDLNHLNVEMYSPNYLFNADNTPATRPTISISKASSAPGGSFTVTGSEELSMVSMIRMGTSTHSANYDQRRLELCGPSSTPCGGATPSLTIPGVGVAIPGPWMVFGINQAGIVSKAEILTVT